MVNEIVVETCPQCGAPVKAGRQTCEYCGAEFVVSSLASLAKYGKTEVGKYIHQYKELSGKGSTSGELDLAAGICNLDLGLYEVAANALYKATQEIPERAETHYYYALSLMNGKKPEALKFGEAKKIEEYINAAIQADDTKAVYYYFLAIIRHDFYNKTGFKAPPPSPDELLEEARGKNYDKSEIESLFKVAKVSNTAFSQQILAV